MTATSIPAFLEPVLGIVRANIALVEPIVFALGFAESIVFLSLLVPSSALFLGIGGIHGAVGGTFWTVWIAASLGAFLGDVVSYVAGRYYKEDIGQMWPLSRNPGWYIATRTFFQRWGMLGILGGKFTGFMRPFLPVVAGAMQMPWPSFLWASAVSSLIWAGVFLAPGYGLMQLAR